MDAISTGLGALLGRKKLSVTNVRRAGSVLSGFSRSGREEADVERAAAAVEREKAKLAEIEAELESEAAELGQRYDPQSIELGTSPSSPAAPTSRCARCCSPGWRTSRSPELV